MIIEAQAKAREAMSRAGDWLTGEQRIDAWKQVREARSNPLDRERKDALSPNSVVGSHPATKLLSAEAVEVLHRVATDPGRLTRGWADEQMAVLGASTYTELVGVTAIAMTLDRFDEAVGVPWSALPEAVGGPPSQVVPENVGDVGAWVPQTMGPTRANVTRTLSAVPVTDATWRSLVDSHYSRGPEFMSATWDRALSRPQIELVAARITALSECFY